MSFYAAGPFDDYPGFQLFLTLGKHFAPECMYSTVDKSKVEISQNFVTFSEYMNFKLEIWKIIDELTHY